MLTLKLLPALWLMMNTNAWRARWRWTEQQLSGVVLVRRNPKPLLQPIPLTLPWTWDCPVGVAGGDVAMATTAVEQVGILIESGVQLFNGPEGGEKWLTGPTNKAWSGMWEYAAPLFNKHLRNAHRTLSCCCLILLSNEAITYFLPVDLLFVYFSLMHQIVWNTVLTNQWVPVTPSGCRCIYDSDDSPLKMNFIQKCNNVKIRLVESSKNMRNKIRLFC